MRKSLSALSIALFIISFFLCSISTAQCLGGISGLKTIGPTGNYASLTEAVLSTASNGVQGPVIFEFQSSYNSSAETFPVIIPQINCVNGTNTVTIRPQIGATTLTISSSHATATIDLNGADNIIFDGRPVEREPVNN